jgi:hypothetical protein
MVAAMASTPNDIHEVIDQLIDVQFFLDKLPPLYRDSPVAEFNNLYIRVTRRILKRRNSGTFEDSPFLTTLDVELAKRYFDALRNWSWSFLAAPESWAELYRCVDNRNVPLLSCAAAGVNAHVNYDLPFALVATWRKLGFGGFGSPQHRDYLLVNELLFDALPQLRRTYLQTWQRCVERTDGTHRGRHRQLLPELAPDLAWDRALRVWSVRDSPDAVESARVTFDRRTAVVGRALLWPSFGVAS